MPTAGIQEPPITARRHIHSGWDELFLYARTKQKLGIEVAPPELDADLHIETTTIMFADVVESVRLIEQDELANVTRIRTLLKRLVTEVVPMFQGTLLERRGDGLLIKFPSGARAAACAEVVHSFAEFEGTGISDEMQIRFRIGIHGGEMLADAESIFGRGINLAARVTSLAKPGDTVCSGSVRDQLVHGLDADVEDLGDCHLKHVAEPVRAFRLRALDDGGPRPVLTSAIDPLALPTLAVLPFSVPNATDDLAGLGDLAAEAVIHTLARANRIQVTAWLSSRARGLRELSARQIGEKLGVSWVLSGTINVVGARVVLSIELVDAKSGVIAWTDRCVDAIDDLIQTESALAAQIASGVVMKISDTEAMRVARHPLPNVESHRLLVGAIGLMHRSAPREFHRAREALEHLLERHPRMHGVRPWLAKWYVLRTTRGNAENQKDDANRANEQTSRALDAMPTDTFSMAMDGFVQCHLRHDLALASSRLNEAVTLNPNEAMAWLFSTTVLGAQGDQGGAWTAAERALRLSPIDPQNYYYLSLAAGAAYFAGKVEKAIELGELSFRQNAIHTHTLRILLYALVDSSRVAEARDIAQKLMLLEPSLNVKGFEQRSIQPAHVRKRLAANLLVAGIPAV